MMDSGFALRVPRNDEANKNLANRSPVAGSLNSTIRRYVRGQIACAVN